MGQPGDRQALIHSYLAYGQHAGSGDAPLARDGLGFMFI